MHSPVALAVALVCLQSLAAAQIDPSKVPQATRENWCVSQKTSCPLLCAQFPGESSATTSNTCDAPTLSFSCVCSNGQQPNASEYSQTIPYFICTESNTQCVNNCPSSDSACQSACREKRPCGAQEPKRVNTSTISTMTATAKPGEATTSKGQVFTGLGGAAATGTAGTGSKVNAGTVAIDLGRGYGLAAVMGGIFAGFALLL
ncbi:MAG: hypothetical protein M1832_001762 [Thelocarpon impressellum]|nr:MAG: hypothetical protein M1832_001762 [Thelocarpon impressellum]